MPEAGVGVLLGALVSGLAAALGLEVISEHEQFDFEFFMIWCARNACLIACTLHMRVPTPLRD